MKNQTYEGKRDFNKTKEPRGKKTKKTEDGNIFVIQKHDATNLHYDFRLEIDNTLKSWSVPKGPSMNPSIKRMAIPTEDHPMEYADFEGTIPKGQYGGGTVMVWDNGTFENAKKDDDGNEIPLSEAYKLGSLEFFLHGKKLQGNYALVKMKGGKMKDNWLLMKSDDEFSDARRNPINTERKSVLTGRSIKDIAREDEEK